MLRYEKAKFLEEKFMDEGSRKVLERANRAAVKKEDIIEFVTEIGERGSDRRDFEGRAFVLMQLHKGNPDKSLAIEFRMEALAHMLGGAEPTTWTLPARPDGAVMTTEPVFAAAAVQPLIEVDGRPGFERDAFFDKVLELCEAGGNA